MTGGSKDGRVHRKVPLLHFDLGEVCGSYIVDSSGTRDFLWGAGVEVPPPVKSREPRLLVEEENLDSTRGAPRALPIICRY